jgi:hypothetical protein
MMPKHVQFCSQSIINAACTVPEEHQARVLASVLPVLTSAAFCCGLAGQTGAGAEAAAALRCAGQTNRRQQKQPSQGMTAAAL